VKARLQPAAVALALGAGVTSAAAQTPEPPLGAPTPVTVSPEATTTGGPVVETVGTQARGARNRPAKPRARDGNRRTRPEAIKRAPSKARGQARPEPEETPPPGAPPLTLTADQRDAIYRAVARERGGAPRGAGAAPPMRIVSGPLASGQIVTARPPVTDLLIVPAVPGTPPASPSDAAAPPNPYPIGAQLPAEVPVYAMPESVSVQLPLARSYGYVMIDDRVLLVDPVTNVVVAELEP
jgi:hypothetical protein